MGTLRISLFGVVQIQHSHRSQEEKVTRTIQALLAYLVLQRHRLHSREVLAGLLWGEHDQERARGCLNTAIWRLRRALEPQDVPQGTYLLTNSVGEVGFNARSDYWLDVAVIGEQIGCAAGRPVESISAGEIEQLEAALQLYRGDLLEGFYDDWALSEREHLRLEYIQGLAYLMKTYKGRGQYEKSLACGQRILDLEPAHEEIHRELMRLYLANGQRALAVRQYHSCQETLTRKWGIPLMEETQALYAEIVGESHPPAKGDARPAGLQLQKAIAEMRRSAQHYDQARAQLEKSLQVLERSIREEKQAAYPTHPGF